MTIDPLSYYIGVVAGGIAVVTYFIAVKIITKLINRGK